MHIPVEVVASTLADVKAAAQGGADRVELCVDLDCGGLTPGRSLVEAALSLSTDWGIGVRVLVRPRTGDFVYAPEERDVMVRETEALLDLGVNKVVVGGLDQDGLPDLDFLDQFGRAVGWDRLVFHRALDEAVDHAQSLLRLKAAGVREVLTSGGAARAVEGLEGLAAAAREVTVVAGSGVRPEQAAQLVAAGASALHASCRVTAPTSRPGRLFSEVRTSVDPTMVRSLVEAARAVGRP